MIRTLSSFFLFIFNELASLILIQFKHLTFDYDWFNRWLLLISLLILAIWFLTWSACFEWINDFKKRDGQNKKKTNIQCVSCHVSQNSRNRTKNILSFCQNINHILREPLHVVIIIIIIYSCLTWHDQIMSERHDNRWCWCGSNPPTTILFFTIS